MASVVVKRGKGCIEHNNRERSFCQGNKDINWDETSKNMTLIKRDVKEVFYEIFGESIEEYNKKQKRADRMKNIDDYYESICKEHGKPYEEMIIGVYDKGNDHIDEIDCRLMYGDYIEWMQKNYPNLVIVNAVVHFDEKGQAHMHVDYIPVATGYKQGMSKRFGITKALENLGYKPEVATRKDNAMSRFHHHQRDVMKEIIGRIGIEAEEVGSHRSLTPQEYKNKTMRENALLENEISMQRKELLSLRTETERLKNEKEMLEHAIELTKQKKLDEIDCLLEQAWADYATIPLLRESIRQYEQDFTKHVEQAYADVFDEKDMIRARTRSEAHLEPQNAF